MIFFSLSVQARSGLEWKSGGLYLLFTQNSISGQLFNGIRTNWLRTSIRLRCTCSFQVFTKKQNIFFIEHWILIKVFFFANFSKANALLHDSTNRLWRTTSHLWWPSTFVADLRWVSILAGPKVAAQSWGKFRLMLAFEPYYPSLKSLYDSARSHRDALSSVRRSDGDW